MTDPTPVVDVTLKLSGDAPWTVHEVDGGFELTSPREPDRAMFQTGIRLLVDRAAAAALIEAAAVAVRPPQRTARVA